MKKHLLLCMVLAAFVLPAGASFADDHEWDNGGGNNEQTNAPVDDANDGHSGSEAE